MNVVEDMKNSNIYDGKTEEIENLKKLQKLKSKIFNFGWWRNPPYKNDDFKRTIFIGLSESNSSLISSHL